MNRPSDNGRCTKDNSSNEQHSLTSWDRNKKYLYRNWSHIEPDPSDLESIRREQSLHPVAQRLPTKLSRILSDPGLSGVISWLPHGRSWRIINRVRFTNEVMPPYFDHANFNSFIRLVNSWGFRRVPSGVDMDSYYHELFLRDKPHLHSKMKRLLLNERKVPVDPRDRCPNFYLMEGTCAATQQNVAIPSSNTSTHTNNIKSSGEASVKENQSSVNHATMHDLKQIYTIQRPILQRHSYTPNLHIALPYQPSHFQYHDGFIDASTSSSFEYSLLRQRNSSDQTSLLSRELRWQYRSRVDGLPTSSATICSQQNWSRITASTTISSDPLVNMLTNMLRSRVQIEGPPRTNDELIGLLCDELAAVQLFQAPRQAHNRSHEAVERFSTPTRMNNANSSNAIHEVSQPSSREREQSNNPTQLPHEPTAAKKDGGHTQN